MTARQAAPWLLLGVLGWGYLVWLGATMLQTSPPTAGFDLALLSEAARRLGEGQSPYDPDLVAGAVVEAQSLFYSYPPPVAVAMRALAWLPDPVVLVVWGLAATIAAVAVGVRIARRVGADGPTVALALPIAATLPFVLPYAVALLFGNLNVWFPALYGLMLLAATSVGAAPVTGWRRTADLGGVALAIAGIAKLHPASLGAWFVVRGWRPGAGRDGAPSRRVVLVAIATGIGILIVSIVLTGLGAWLDYVGVIRAGSGADLVDVRNGAPAVIAGMALGAGPDTIRVLQAVVSIAAVVVTVLAAWRTRDPVLSFAIAAVASLVTLPVTWYHYPVALIPFGIAAIARAGGAATPAAGRRVPLLVVAALATATVAIVWLPLLWVAIAILLVAIHASRPPQSAGTDGAGTIG